MSSESINTRELSISSTLYDRPDKILAIDEVDYGKISVMTQYNTKYDLKDHYITYMGNTLWLSIEDVKGYFTFDNNVVMGYLKLLLGDKEAAYDKLLQNIANIADIVSTSKVLKDALKIRLSSDEFPVEREFRINAAVFVLEMVVQKGQVFYPLLFLNCCSYDI